MYIAHWHSLVENPCSDVNWFDIHVLKMFSTTVFSFYFRHCCLCFISLLNGLNKVLYVKLLHVKLLCVKLLQITGSRKLLMRYMYILAFKFLHNCNQFAN